MHLALPSLIFGLVLLSLTALFSLSEAAFLAVNKARLRHLMQRGAPAAKVVYRLLTHLDQLITTILVANSFTNTAISVMGTLVCIRVFGDERGPWIATLVVTVVVLVFGEITPKIFAAGHADRVALVLATPMRVLIFVLRPLTRMFSAISNAIIRLLGGQRLARSPLITEEELKVMIEMGREAGVIAEQELRLLHRIFEFTDSVVREAMVPRDDMVAIELTAKSEEVLDMLIEEGHSRVPVYEGTLDHIVGVLYARDLLTRVRHGGLFALQDLVRPVKFVPETKRIAELLTEFQRDRMQIAIVQDAKGTTRGLVTLEDLVEEIVGEIQEEAPQRRKRS